MAVRTLVLANMKGGVSKTGSTLSIAGCLADMFPHKKVLIIDCDPQGNASLGLGYPIPKVERGTSALFEEANVSLDHLLCPTSIDNLFVVPTEISLAQIEVDLLDADPSQRYFHLKKKLDQFAVQKGDWFVLIDTPPSMGIFTMNAFVAADRVLTPVTPDLYAVMGLKYLINNVESVRLRINPKLKLIGLFRSLWEKGNSENTKTVDRYLLQHFPDQLLQTTIPSNVAVKNAQYAHIPVNFYERSAPAAKAYRQLTEEVLQRWLDANRER